MKRTQTYYDEMHLSKEECRARAKNAVENNCWINYKKDWYTPEEFVQAAESQDIYMHPGYTSFESKAVKIRDPRGVIPRLDDRLEYFKKLRDQFASKVDEYYRKK